MDKSSTHLSQAPISHRFVLNSEGEKINRGREPLATPTRTDRKCGFDLVLSDQQPTDSLSAGLPFDGETSKRAEQRDPRGRSR